jgi:hypothetical protein
VAGHGLDYAWFGLDIGRSGNVLGMDGTGRARAGHGLGYAWVWLYMVWAWDGQAMGWACAIMD